MDSLSPQHAKTARAGDPARIFTIAEIGRRRKWLPGCVAPVESAGQALKLGMILQPLLPGRA